MYKKFWFGVKVEFVCFSCCITSIVKDVMNSTTEELATLQKAIASTPQKCQHCQTPLADGAEVDVQIVPGTPESLKNLGFPVPPGALGA